MCLNKNRPFSVYFQNVKNEMNYDTNNLKMGSTFNMNSEEEEEEKAKYK